MYSARKNESSLGDGGGLDDGGAADAVLNNRARALALSSFSHNFSAWTRVCTEG
jgi:hypothetical protein